MRDVPQRGINKMHSAKANAFLRTQLLAEWFCERGLLTAGGTESAGRTRYLSGNVELTFLGHPFESLGRAFDTILAVIAIGRKQPDHLIGAAGGRTRDIAGSKIDSLTDGEFVLQRLLHHAKNVGVLTVPLQPPTENPAAI